MHLCFNRPFDKELYVGELFTLESQHCLFDSASTNQDAEVQWWGSGCLAEAIRCGSTVSLKHSRHSVSSVSFFFHVVESCFFEFPCDYAKVIMRTVPSLLAPIF